MCLVPVNIEIVASGDIVPLNNYGAVESRLVGRPTYDHACFVPVIAINDRTGCRVRSIVAIRGTGNEEFLFDVTRSLQIFKRGKEGVLMRRISGGSGCRNRTGYRWSRGGRTENEEGNQSGERKQRFQ